MREIVCEVLRGDRVEAVHRVAVAVVRGRRPILEVGRTREPFFIRSCAKPFQAMTVLESGAVDAFGITPPELAVICGSHPGEPRHVEAVRSILTKSGVGVRGLKCGVHAPLTPLARRKAPSPGPVHNNCSGKHAGMLAAARHLEASLKEYLHPEHPVQWANLRMVSRQADVPVGSIEIGVDGCSAPTFALPLLALARAGASLAGEGGTAAEIRTVMMRHPEMVGVVDAALMRTSPGRLVTKGGAEGAHLTGIVKAGVGIAIKVLDGNARVIPHVLDAVLRRLKLLDTGARRRIGEVADATRRNHAGLPVGMIRVRT